MNRLLIRLSAALILLSAVLVSCNKDDEPTPELGRNDVREEISLGKYTIEPVTVLRNGAVGENSSKLTFYTTTGEKGLSVYLKTEGAYVQCDVDKDGCPDFFMTTKTVSANETELTYYNKEKTPLQTVLIRISDARATVDVIKVYPANATEEHAKAELRAWFGGGRETWGQCFSRRMGSPAGITMNIIAGFVGSEGPVGVGIGAALSCVVYNPF
jgi:lipoprotein